MREMLFATACMCVMLAATQGKSIHGENENGDKSQKMWQPSSGSREDWLRCHGFPCEQWERTRAKLLSLKVATAGPGLEMASVFNTMDDSLDNCIWLTEDQLDNILEEMEESFYESPDAGMGPVTGGADVHRRQKRKVTDFSKRPFNMWLNKTVHWKFDGAHTDSEKAFIRGAFQHWEDQTCLNFVELETKQAFSDNHILVTKRSTGCHSFIGRISAKPQQLNLQGACLTSLGTPVHEVGHALGLWHEQQRSDRDDTIRVNWENVGYYRGQFHKQSTNNLVPYDLGSVMHYAPRDGSKNGKNTMESLNPLYQNVMGQRTGLSFLDAKIINVAYCSDSCGKGLKRPCLHGGYQDPKACDRCKCPDGLSGTFCDKVAPSVNANCGGSMVATTTAQYIESPGYSSVGYYNNHQECSWRITAPVGSHVALNFEGKFAVYCYHQNQCHHWVEVKYKKDIGERGPRFCCYKTPSATVVSESNKMLVVFKANWTENAVATRTGFRARIVLGEHAGNTAENTRPTTTEAPTTTTVTTPSTSTTVTTPTTSTTTETTPIAPWTTEVPQDKPGCDVVDLMLAIDASGGVMEENWSKMVLFAKNIVRKMSIGRNQVRVGLIVYGSSPKLQVRLGETITMNGLLDAFDKAPFLMGATATDKALALTREEFTARGRTGVRKVAILITDGQTQDSSRAKSEALSARTEDIDLYVVGITMKVDTEEAVMMTGDPNKFLQIDNFDDIINGELNYALATHNVVCVNEDGMGGESDLDWRCSFESGNDPMCAMHQETERDQFDWTRHQKSTPSGHTGPMKAKDGSFYIFVEASDPRKPGDKAIIFLPDFKKSGQHCLRFSYSMFGFHVRTLQVLKQSPGGVMIPLWQRSGDYGMPWYDARVPVSLAEGDKLAFVGVRGNGYSGDIAIDDIRVTGGSC